MGTNMDRLRLSEFVEWIGESKETFRSILNRGEAPFERQIGTEKQRTYSGKDLLAWCLFTQLRRAGIPVGIAGETVRLSMATANFYAERQRTDPEAQPQQLHLVLASVRRDRGERGKTDFLHQFTETPEGIADFLQKESASYGKTNEVNGYVNLGLVSLVTVPIQPCYDRCRATAEAHGFRLEDGDLFEIED